MADKLARQKNEIERLKAQVQQQEKVLQEHYQIGQGQSGAADVARWQALLKERDTALATIKKQTIAQHQAMTQQINHLQTQLAEKDAVLAGLKGLPAESGRASDGQGDGGDLAALRAEKARTDKLVENLTRIIGAQQKAIEKHRKEAERLARELHALAAGIQMLGQSLSDQAGEMSSALVGEE